MSTIKKTIAYVSVAAIAVIIGGYFALNNGNDVQAQSTLTKVDGTEGSSAVGDDILILLGQIESLTIDTKLFSSNEYTSLVDLTVEIPEQSIGRPNPFAPFDRFAAVVTAVSTTKTTTKTTTTTSKLLPTKPH